MSQSHRPTSRNLRALSAGHVALAAATLAFSAAGRAEEAPKSDFEYHGYMRSGIGGSRGDTDQVCFSAPGASAKFRLGNECETYIEADFEKTTVVGKGANAPSFKTHLRFATVSGGDHDWESTSTSLQDIDKDGVPVLGGELTIAMREAFVQADNVLGSARPWVGKRFYRRQDIHILDYYIINDSGPGAGIEDINLGVGKLHFAVMRNIPGVAAYAKADTAATRLLADDRAAQVNLDLRLSDIALGGAGKLEVLLIEGSAGNRGHATGKDEWEKVSGLQLGLVHTIDVTGGFNRVTIQRGSGLFGGVSDGIHTASTLDSYGADGSQSIAKGADDELKARKKSSSLRIAEELVSEFGKTLSNSLVLLYQTTDSGNVKSSVTGKDVPTKNEMLFGVRPIYHFNDTEALAFEYGMTSVKNAVVSGTEYKDATLNKVTLAPQLTAGEGFWARPTLRVFATYASWNEASKGAVGQGGNVYASNTSGFSTGAQLEAWW